jgi:hypothetical protein
MNPIIKFTTLFGLLAVELAIELSRATSAVLAVVFFAISTVFVWRSFYAMRIRSIVPVRRVPAAAAPMGGKHAGPGAERERARTR